MSIYFLSIQYFLRMFEPSSEILAVKIHGVGDWVWKFLAFRLSAP